MAGKTTTWVNPNDVVSEQGVNIVSVHGKCDTPLRVTPDKSKFVKNVQNCTQKSVNHYAGGGVKATIASGQQKVAPLGEDNRCGNKLKLDNGC